MDNDKDNKEFKGIWIPKEFYKYDLTDRELLVLSVINGLDNKDGCYAKNEKLAEMTNRTVDSLTRTISSLKYKKIIVCEYEYKKSNPRTIYISEDIRKDLTPIGENIESHRGKPLTHIGKTAIYNNRKDYNKVNKKRENRPHEFLKINDPKRFEDFEIQNKKHVGQWEDLLEGFSDKVIIEKLEWDPAILFARLNTYVRQWRSNENGKETAKQEPKAVYLKKIS